MQQNLGIKLNPINTAYSAYRPGLNTCGGEHITSFPYDWAPGFYKSSISSGGYGVGQKLPYASEIFLVMVGEMDRAKREELAAQFYEENRFWANCVGIFEEPIWPMPIATSAE